MEEPDYDRILRVRALVNDGDLASALRLLEGAPIVPADLASTAERLRGCLAIRLGDIEVGFAILDRNRTSGVPSRRIPMPYRFVVEPTELERVSRGLFDCLATGSTPDAIIGVADDFATASTLSHVRVLGRRLKLEKRAADSKIALAMYERWLEAAMTGLDADARAALATDLQERLRRWGDRAGARALERHLVDAGG